MDNLYYLKRKINTVITAVGMSKENEYRDCVHVHVKYVL